MIKNAIFLSCDAGIALVLLNCFAYSLSLESKFQDENFVKVLNFDKVQATVCHSEEGGITLEIRQR
ncbi:hypothetical protein FF52_04665 [Flavobacterium sp. F52]|nr:hypothetical protein FF52_04665 [Flavobacterium sp. F52]